MIAEQTDLDLFERFCATLVLESGKRMVLEPFQQTMLADYFAGCDETVVIIGKKNGKSSLIAALALFHMLTTVDAECVIGAASRDQAMILWRQAAGLVKRSESIRYLFVERTRELRSVQDDGRIRVLAADADTADGVIPSLAIVDELHRHRSGDLYGVFRDGLVPRNGQIITISTAGADIESPLGLIRTKAHKLADLHRIGAAYRCARSDDGNFVMHEWALDPGEDLDNIDLVKEANPASWQTVKELRARHDSPATQSWQWARFACGVWVRGYDQWIPRHIWDERTWNVAGNETVADEYGEIPTGTEVVLGFDGSYNNDSTALVACTLPKAGVPHLSVAGFWPKPDGAPDDWSVPILEVEQRIRDCCKRWKVREISADPARWARSLEILDSERGKLGCGPIVSMHQGPARMVPATSRLYTAVHNGGMTHSGDADLARHIENATISVGASGGQIHKPKKKSELKIDLAVAAILAFDRAAFYKPRVSEVIAPWDVLASDGEVLQDLAQRKMTMLERIEEETRELIEGAAQDRKDWDEFLDSPDR